jgi:hypothetical protein
MQLRPPHGLRAPGLIISNTFCETSRCRDVVARGELCVGILKSNRGSRFALELARASRAYRVVSCLSAGGVRFGGLFVDSLRQNSAQRS